MFEQGTLMIRKSLLSVVVTAVGVVEVYQSILVVYVLGLHIFQFGYYLILG